MVLRGVTMQPFFAFPICRFRVGLLGAVSRRGAHC